MNHQRSKKLMRRAGVEHLPLAHCANLGEFNDELSKLSDAQLLDAWARTLGIAATRMSDEELLAELDHAQEEEHDNDPTSAVD
jgi:hypothetical protein